MYGRHQKKFAIYRPYNGTGNSVPFPFNFREVAVLVRFQTVSHTELERELPSMVIEQQNGSRQFSDRDRARARAT